MKRFFAFAVMAVVMCAQLFADTYRDALDQYMLVGNAINEKQYEQLLSPMAEKLFPDSKEQAAAIMAEYFARQMRQDIVDIYEPVFRKYVSEDELKELTALYGESELAQMQERATRIVTDMQATEEYLELAKRLQNAMALVLMGQELPEDMQIPAHISPEYTEAFMRFYNQSRFDETITSSFRSAMSIMENSMRKEGIPEPEKKAQTILQYAMRNLPVVFISVFHRFVTMDNMQQLAQIATLPAYQHVMDATSELTANPIQLTESIFTKMADWVGVHYPQYADGMQRLLENIKSMR